MVDVVPNDSQRLIAMTAEQQELWMRFIREDKTYCKYYDEFVVLLGMRMRVGELTALHWAEVDLEKAAVIVKYNLYRPDGEYRLSTLKTKSSTRGWWPCHCRQFGR